MVQIGSYVRVLQFLENLVAQKPQSIRQTPPLSSEAEADQTIFPLSFGQYLRVIGVTVLLVMAFMGYYKVWPFKGNTMKKDEAVVAYERAKCNLLAGERKKSCLTKLSKKSN